MLTYFWLAMAALWALALYLWLDGEEIPETWESHVDSALVQGNAWTADDIRKRVES